MQLKRAVDTCLELSPKGKCFEWPQGAIELWDVSRVIDISHMFARAKFFESDLSRWHVSRAENMRGMFLGATSFNGDLSKWDVTSVKDMSSMFSFARSFNGDMSKWDVSRVKKAYSMFWGAASFNADLSKWDVSNVDDMHSMFSFSTSFSSDISKWNVSSVKDMNAMFLAASSFRSDISKWDVSSVTEMKRMFYKATAFAQKLCKAAWVHSKASKTFMFEGSSGSISPTTCATTSSISVYSPQSKAELKTAVDTYLMRSPKHGKEMQESEASRSAARSDHDTLICKPAVCLKKLCAWIDWCSNAVVLLFTDAIASFEADSTGVGSHIAHEETFQVDSKNGC